MKIYCVNSVEDWDYETVNHKYFLHEKDARKEMNRINKKDRERAWLSEVTVHEEYLTPS